MIFDNDEENKLRARLKQIYVPVRATNDLKQVMLNHLLDSSLSVEISITKSDPFARIFVSVLGFIAVALIVYGYLAASHIY